MATQQRGGDGAPPKGGSALARAQARREAEVPSGGDALDQALNELEKKIDRVRTLYDQYFMGIEKMEPQVARKEVTRTMLLYAQQHIKNTGQRFRFHSLQQKWNIYITLWNRTMREIEAGTYRRDVARVTRKLAREGRELPEEAAIELGLKRRTGSSPPATQAAGPQLANRPNTPPVEKPGTPPPRGLAPTPPPGMARALHPTPPPRSNTPVPPGVTEEQMRALYRRYVQAKRLVADPAAESIKYESLLATVAKQTPQIMQKYGVQQVEFTVVIRDDKVVLKAIPKK